MSVSIHYILPFIPLFTQIHRTVCQWKHSAIQDLHDRRLHVRLLNTSFTKPTMLNVPYLSYALKFWMGVMHTRGREITQTLLAALLPCQSPAQTHLWRYVCASTAGIVTTQQGGTVNRLDMESFTAFIASLPSVSKADWRPLQAHIDTHQSMKAFTFPALHILSRKYLQLVKVYVFPGPQVHRKWCVLPKIKLIKKQNPWVFDRLPLLEK